MILNISNSLFKKVFDEEKFYLPIRWDGKDFAATLENLLDEYRHTVQNVLIHNWDGVCTKAITEYIQRIDKICYYLNKAVKKYLGGFPSEAYDSLGEAMYLLMEQPLQVYHKTVEELLELGHRDTLDLFRVTYVTDNIPYTRERVFHTPYSLRSKVATTRYSIAGYPSLYLGTSLQLCCEEINYNRHHALGLCSKFKINRSSLNDDVSIDVIELALKPQDFLHQRERETLDNPSSGRKFDNQLLEEAEVKFAYLLWYPLIAACSYIRVNKKDPFAAEYIIPQLLMQWVRNEMAFPQTRNFRNRGSKLIGIRYFSCASQKASEMGFNYVFPTSGEQKSPTCPYCPVLLRAFKLTMPRFIHEYESIAACERELRKANDLDFISKP